MTQHDLVIEMYKACVKHDQKRIEELRELEMEEIVKHKAEGKPFDGEWTIIEI